jgi:hypothetical protein
MVKTKPFFESNNPKASSKDYFEKTTENIVSMRRCEIIIYENF